MNNPELNKPQLIGGNMQETHFQFRASLAQKRLWLHEQLGHDAAIYHINTLLELEGELDENALQQGINDLVARHESFRTDFIWQEETLFQRCHESMTLLLEKVEHTDDEAALYTQLNTASTRPFDLRQAPLARFVLFRCGPRRHLLLIVLHHIISDGWSAGIISRELAACYNARRQGHAAALPELDIQYIDYSEWQHEQQNGEEAARELAWWQEKLHGVEPIELPYDRPRPNRLSLRGKTRFFTVPETLAKTLSDRARARNSTLYSLLLSAFTLILHRYSGQSDLAIGSPVAGRGRLELEGIVGFFVNTLVYRIQLEPEARFADLQQQVFRTVVEALEHQNVSFDRLVERINPTRDLSYSPLFQVMFSFDENQQPGWDFAGLTVSSRPAAGEQAKFDLTLSMEKQGEQLQGAFEYSSDLFDAVTIAQLEADFLFLLEKVAEDDTQPLTAYPCITASVQQSAPRCVHAVDQTLHQRFEQQVERYPHAIAVSTGAGAKLTYTQLNHEANRLAHYLLLGQESQPALRNELVGICMDRDEALPAVILAVLKAGMAYLPIDSALSADRVRFYIEDAGIKQVIGTAAYQTLFDSCEVDYLCIDCEGTFIHTMPESNPSLPVSPEALAYVIYTSGSTGTPKGVEIPHANVMRLFTASERHFSFGPQDVWTLFHSSAFDFSVWEIWGALLYGARLSVVPYWVSRSPEQFRQWVSDENVTVLNQTPSAFAQFIAADASHSDATPLQLRYVIMGGEALEPATLLGWLAKYGDASPQIINMYGITETTVHVTWRRITLADALQGGKSPIGVPLDDLEIWLLDAHQRPVPPGVVGEMYIGGAGVARGYHNRAALTQERFIAKGRLFGADAEDGTRLYRSGDLARRRRDGALEYLGRADHQVKIRGFRIEPGEIEAALQRLEGVDQAVVKASTDSRDRQTRLVAWIATREKNLNIDTLRLGLRDTLPDYMLPAAFVFMEALPLTANGKLDRRALPEPQAVRPQLASHYQAPRSETEAALMALWRDVLKVDEIGIHDNFFALGGDSLRGVQLAGRAREQGLPLTLVNLFQHQTVAELATLLDTQAGSDASQPGSTAPFSQISAQDRARLPPEAIDAYPLSRMQAGMFYHMNLAPDANVYHCTGTSHLRINAPFNEAAFRQAVAQTVAAHDVLRTGFDFERYSQPLQLVWPQAALPIVVEDLRHLDHQAQEDCIKALLEQERHTPFDLQRPTLLRFFIQLRSATSFQFTMTECHPVFDGWSYHTMIVEVFNRYAALTGVSPWQPEKKPRQAYRDFIVQEQAAINDEAQRRYWQQTLADCTILRLPHQAQAAKQGEPPRLKSLSFTLDNAIYQGMRQLMQQLGVPLKSILLAAHVKVLSVFSGERDVLTGIPTNGRPETEGGDALYGLYLNILPFRQVLTGQSWMEMIRQTFENECAAIPHRCYPLAEIQRHFGPQPLLDEVLFNYMDFHIYDRMSPALGLSVVDKLNVQEVHEGTHFTLNAHFQHKTLSSALVNNQVSVQLDYNARLLTQQQIEQIAACYQRVLSAMVAAPQTSYCATDFVPLEQKIELAEFSQGPQGYSGAETLATLFARQVAANPDACAIEWQTHALTYRELDQQSDRLALMLAEKGIAHGSRVALLLGRCTEFVLAVLALSKLEAVYVPLNPEDPQARQAEQITDAGCVLLLTHQRQDAFDLPQMALTAIDLRQGSLPETPFTSDSSNALPLYVMYTSGSTGKAKGVLIPQQGVIRLVKQVSYLDFTQYRRFLMLASVSFDASTLEIWGPLLNGGTIIIYPQGAVALPELETLLIERQVESLFLTTSLFNLLVDECPQALRQVRQAITGGEAMSLRHAARISQRYPQLVLINGYGPTENTTFTTSWRYRPIASDIAPIGRPNEGNLCWILDAFSQPVPVGTPGELYIGGPGLALEYLNQPELYQQRFIRNPFDAERSAQLYRTGDRARFLPDGTIEYLGRLDDQCKIRGFRIETGEIEAALCRYPAIERAAVKIVESAKGKRIIAWLAMQAGCPFDASALRTWLLQRLPRYMIPVRFQVLEAWPLTVNGKLDMACLSVDDDLSLAASASPALLSDPTAQAIQQIWATVLGVVAPSQQENFFDLGGDSLLLARVHLRLSAIGYSQLSMLDLLNYPTIQQLADYINGRQAQPEVSLNTLQHQVDTGRRRLAGLQQRRSGK
ncbi:amino acid adenylation domain-containing protein [Pantoea sp. FN0305]|uniref:amino acid adenylation domain-containing protein n=1 Tax=Pantoea sp. FN0305 TaxID=3418559 RepID=UPI003CF93C1C